MEQLIAQKFLGTLLNESFRRVLISNITPLYDGILQRASVIESSRGFYNCATLSIQGQSYRILKIYPGNSIIDILKLISPVVEEIFLVGLVGSLKDDVKIGDIVCPGEAVDIEHLCMPLPLSSNGSCRGRVCQVNGLLQEINTYKNLKANYGIDFVDMESYYLASFSARSKKRCKTIGVVSDKPIDHPFYRVDNPPEINFDSIFKNFSRPVNSPIATVRRR